MKPFNKFFLAGTLLMGTMLLSAAGSGPGGHFLFQEKGLFSGDTLVFTSDIDHFWEAYDSCQATSDSLKQLHFIQTLYVDRGTVGLKTFMEVRDYSAPHWVHLIRTLPKFWNSIRSHTLAVKAMEPQFVASVQRLKAIYPKLRPSKMYFTVGGLRSGGTTMRDMVLIGTEIATGDSTVDVSEFRDDWLKHVFHHQSLEYVVPLNVHEYVHTQQLDTDGNDLLSQCIKEGGADFIAALATGIPLKSNYMIFGKAHEPELKAAFKNDMFTPALGQWLYNGGKTPLGAGDLGYFMGYELCKSYYDHCADKAKAVREIIEINVADTLATLNFLDKSGYYAEAIDRQALIRYFTAHQPVVVGTQPFSNGDTTVDPDLQGLTVEFSQPMKPGAFSISYGPGGRETSPEISNPAYKDGNKLLTITIALKPGRDYEMVFTGRRFAGEQTGYPLKEYTLRFRTRAH